MNARPSGPRVADPLAAAARFATSVPGQILLNTAAFTLPEELRIRPEWRVLDISCGRAALIRVVADRAGLSGLTVGLDPSRPLLTRGRRDMQLEGGPAIRLVQGAAATLPFASDSLDLLLAGHAFRLLPDEDVLACLREARRVLKPGALLLAWEFAPTQSQRLDGWNRWLLSRREPVPRLRSYRELRGLALTAAFDWVEQAHLRPFLFPPIPRVSLIVGKAPAGWRQRVIDGRRVLQFMPGDAAPSETR